MKRLVTLGLVIAALGLGGCAQRQQTAMRSHGKEYFPEVKYGRASPRVVAEGEEVPKGGGQYLVGKPYSVAGHTYVPSERKFAGTGLASWYGDAFHGRRTANGEVYDKDSVSGAHPTMPLPSYARVTNLRNHHSIIVRVNDRGPYHDGRIMDLSSRAAEALGYATSAPPGSRSNMSARPRSAAPTTTSCWRRCASTASRRNSTISRCRRPWWRSAASFREERPAPAQAVRDIERVAMIQPETRAASPAARGLRGGEPAAAAETPGARAAAQAGGARAGDSGPSRNFPNIPPRHRNGRSISARSPARTRRSGFPDAEDFPRLGIPPVIA